MNKRTVAYIVNGDPQSAMAYRAKAFAVLLSDHYDVRITYRSHSRALSIIYFLTFLYRIKPEVSYVFDMAYSGVLAAIIYQWIVRNHLIIDTGDAIYELARSTGGRGGVGEWFTYCLEWISLKAADCIVVRGTFHKTWLVQRGIQSEVIPDGVDTTMFAPLSVEDLRKRYGLDGILTIGLIGSSIWSEKLQMCYGWELVETIRLLKDAPVKAVMIGSGSGIPRLQSKCKEYGIENKVLFLGHVDYEKLPQHINLFDVCLSTQTNDPVGQVRTTGKLPLYLACGRFILASRVGEAACVLPDFMLIDYHGVKDVCYPQKLTERIKEILEHPEKLKFSQNNVAIARKHFNYPVLAARMKDVIETILARGQDG